MNIFLDLEKTVIEDWFDPTILENNIVLIKKLISDLEIKFSTKVNKMILFSAAVVNNNDIEIFNRSIKHSLEEQLNIGFSEIFLFSTENLFSLAETEKNVKSLSTDFLSDIFNWNLKAEVFELLALRDHRNCINILFDDTVDNSIKEVFEGPLFSENKTTLISIKV